MDIKVTKAGELVIKRKVAHRIGTPELTTDNGKPVPNPYHTEEVQEMKRIVREWCDTANGRATARTIGVSDVDWMIGRYKEMAENFRLPIKALEGFGVNADPNGQTFPRAYKYTPMSTTLDITVRGANYILIARREMTHRNRELRFTQGVPQSVIDAIKANW